MPKSEAVNSEVNLMLVLFEEDGIHYAYSPELDLNGYGKTQEEAQRSFEVVLSDYLEFAVRNKTLLADLLKQGWQLSEKLTPPSFNELLQRNNELAERMLLKPLVTSESVRIPAFS
jgi:hypothetical protein